MSEAGGVLDTQVSALLDLVEEYRRRECDALLARARRQREELLHQAHGEARRRMHQAVGEARRRHRERIDAARAGLETRARQQRHQAARLLLDQAWERLQQTLQARWHEPEPRRCWLARICELAIRHLPPDHWEVLHPPGWSEQDAAWLREKLQPHTGHAPRFRADQHIAAGVRIHAGGACLDGTIEGMLARRGDLAAELMGELHELQGQDP